MAIYKYLEEQKRMTYHSLMLSGFFYFEGENYDTHPSLFCANLYNHITLIATNQGKGSEMTIIETENNFGQI